MPRSYRSIVVALVGWLSLAAVNPQPQANKQTEAAQQHAEPPQRAPEYRAYPDKNADPCYYAKDHDAADLCAQWRAAIAAEKAAKAAQGANGWAMVAAILSLFGVGGIIYALLQTHSALGEARKGNELAEQTARRELRAYVTTEDHDIIEFFRGGPTILRAKIWNRGQTPAYDMKVWSIVGGTLDEPDDFKVMQKKRDDFRQSKSVLGPGQWMLHENGCQGPLENDAYIGIATGGIKLVFAGVVTYRDAFGRRRFTTFKQFYTGTGNWATKAADLTACGKGNNGS